VTRRQVRRTASVRPHRRQIFFEAIISNLLDERSGFKPSNARWRCGLTIGMVALLMIVPDPLLRKANLKRCGVCARVGVMSFDAVHPYKRASTEMGFFDGKV
jgi:hypothetical protein